MSLNLFRKESLSRYLKADNKFVKSLSAGDLMAMGIGAVIGTGIFILPGTVAANDAGPGVSLSFLAAAVVCALAGMCYAEFSSAMPVAGSAYSYGNVVYGEFIGWIMGWALVLEYMLAVASVSTGWAAYFNSLLASCGINIPKALSGPFDPAHGTYVNIVAIIIVLLITWMLSFGMTSSVRVNNIAIAIKIAIIVAFIVVGAFFIKKGCMGSSRGQRRSSLPFWALTVSQAQLPKSRIRKRTCQSESSGHFWSLPCFTWAFQSS